MTLETKFFMFFDNVSFVCIWYALDTEANRLPDFSKEMALSSAEALPQYRRKRRETANREPLWRRVKKWYDYTVSVTFYQAFPFESHPKAMQKSYFVFLKSHKIRNKNSVKSYTEHIIFVAFCKKLIPDTH